MKYPTPPATISIMTKMVPKRWLFLSWQSEQWETLPRSQGLARFEQSFVCFPHPMVVVAPDFSKFDARFNQTFAYHPLCAQAPRQKSARSREETAFFEKCLARIGDAGGPDAQVALIDGNCLADDGSRWTAPFSEVERRVEILSKQACCERILPALASGVGPDEGGLYAPFQGAGVYCLSSM